ncbi:MAG: hypothetical protein A4E49_00624 [Methanosaeta sp. PtaU1.Bin112]|nr:MAG: hypothetical protein A4E49_00624 [Methanosaeta sp. PtaU1.Bin112]
MDTLEDAKVEFLLPPLRRLTHAPNIAPFLVSNSQNSPQRFPITIFKRSQEGTIEWLGFVFCILYTSKEDRRTLRITYPISFSDKGRFAIYQRLINEVERIASASNVDILEYEGYSMVKGELLFPYSEDFFGNEYNPDFLAELKSQGFETIGKKASYQLDGNTQIDQMSLRSSTKCIDIHTEPDLFARRIKYLQICLKSPDYPELMDISEKALKQPPDIVERAYFQEDHVFFLKKNDLEGCVRWAPTADNKAKIFRILFNQRVDDSILLAGILKSSEKILTRGVSSLQISGISSRGIIDIFEEIGLEPIQIELKLHKQI